MGNDTLQSAPQQAATDKEPGDYREGHLLPGGVRIARILAQSRKVLVFTTDSGALSHLVKNKWKVADYANKVHRFSELLRMIPEDLDHEQRRHLRDELGLQLFGALRAKDVPSNVDHFSGVEQKISEVVAAARERDHLRFVAWTIGYGIAAAIVLSGFFLAAKHLVGVDLLSVVMAIGGAFGACISVLQRERTIDVTRLQEHRSARMFSAVSVALGALSGFVCYWAMRGNVILGVFNATPAAMFVVCVLAGAGERYLNMLGRREAG